MKTITLRNIDDQLKDALRRKAKERSASLNSVVLETLRSALGVEGRPRQELNEALRKLAGSWTGEDANEFDEATRSFEQIDEELWR